MTAHAALATVCYFSTSTLLGLVALTSQQRYRPLLLVLIISFAVLSLRALTADSLGGLEPGFIGVLHVSYNLCFVHGEVSAPARRILEMDSSL